MGGRGCQLRVISKWMHAILWHLQAGRVLALAEHRILTPVGSAVCIMLVEDPLHLTIDRKQQLEGRWILKSCAS